MPVCGGGRERGGGGRGGGGAEVVCHGLPWSGILRQRLFKSGMVGEDDEGQSRRDGMGWGGGIR